MIINTKDITYDFADNYSTVVPAYDKYKTSTDPKSNLLDGMFMQNAFSNSKTGAGYNKGALNIGGEGETQIKFGDNHNKNEADAVGYQLEAGELFKSPWTIGTVNAKEKFQKDAYRYSDISGFYYNASDKVKRHPIYTKEIGDPRWRTGKSWDGGKNHTVKSGDLTY